MFIAWRLVVFGLALGGTPRNAKPPTTIPHGNAAAAALPARTGTFLFQQRSSRLHFFMESEGDRVFVCRFTSEPPNMIAGDEFRLTGGTPLKKNQEILENPTPFHIRPGSVNQPVGVEVGDVLDGRALGHWVRVDGFAVRVRQLPARNLLRIDLDGETPLAVYVDADRDRGPLEWERLYLHQHLRITGCPLKWGPPEEFGGPNLRAASEQDIQHLPKTNAFDLPGIPIQDLKRSLGKPSWVEGIIDRVDPDGVQIWDHHTHLRLRIGRNPLRMEEYARVLGVLTAAPPGDTHDMSGGFRFRPIAYRAFVPKGQGLDLPGPRILLRAIDLQALPPADLASGRPLRLTVRVNAVPEGVGGFFAEDASGGLFAKWSGPLPAVGAWVDIRGITAHYRDIPYAVLDAVLDAPAAALPDPVPLIPFETIPPSREGQLLNLAGAVRAIVPDRDGRGSTWRIALGFESVLAHVRADQPMGEGESRKWLGAIVQLRGTFTQLPAAVPPPDGEAPRKRVWIGRPREDIVLLRKPDEENCEALAQVAAIRIPPDGDLGPPVVRVRGTVVGAGPESALYLQDDTAGLTVLQEQPLEFKVGSQVEVIGLLAPGQPPQLRSARVYLHHSGPPEPVRPSPLGGGADEDARLRDRLIRGEGMFIRKIGGPISPVLEVDLGGRKIDLILPADAPGTAAAEGPWGGLRAGDRLAFTGIYRIAADPATGLPRAAVALLRGDDLHVLPGGSWWTAYHVLGVVLASAVVVCAVALWCHVLKRRLREQTGIISQQKEREEHLESQYGELFENANDFMFILDVEGRITSINRAGERLMGYARGELLGRFLTDFVAPEDRKAVEGMIESDDPVTFEIVVYNHAMRELYIEIGSRPVDNSDNLAVHVVGIGRDITRRKLTEQELRRAFRVLKSHIENSPLAIVEWDRGFRVTRWSGQAEAIFGWKEEDVLFHHTSEWRFVHEEDRQKVEEGMALLLNRHTRNTCSNRNYCKSGAVAYCEWYNSALLDENGELVSILSLVLDVTRRVEGEKRRETLEENIRQVQKMEAIGRLAGGVAHDFNNLLTIINGNSHMLLADRLNREQRDLVAQVKQAGEKAAALTRQLLAFGRKQIAAPREIDVNFILGDLRTMLERMAGESVRIDYDLEPDLPPVLLDPTMTEQVVYNLVVNARDAMPSGGRIRVRTRALPDREGVRLEFEDTGTGMDDATKAKIFEPFFTTKAIGKGTGLGLATVYSVVHQGGGRVEVDSSPGRGTTFRILLPRSAGRPSSFDGLARVVPSASGDLPAVCPGCCPADGKCPAGRGDGPRDDLPRRRRGRPPPTGPPRPGNERLPSRHRHRRPGCPAHPPRTRRSHRRVQARPADYGRDDARSERRAIGRNAAGRGERCARHLHVRLHRRRSDPPGRADGRGELPTEAVLPAVAAGKGPTGSGRRSAAGVRGDLRQLALAAH